jgi:hypothetical protein
VFRCVLGSEGCVLVPRSSGTPVATWTWPTWVVSRRRVLEAVFILLEFSSPSRRIFIGSNSLPPSLVRRIGPSRPRRGRPMTSSGGRRLPHPITIMFPRQSLVALIGRAGISSWLRATGRCNACGSRASCWGDSESSLSYTKNKK